MVFTPPWCILLELGAPTVALVVTSPTAARVAARSLDEDSTMTVAIGADHAGFALKEAIRAHFTAVEFIDVGTYSEASCDYPDYAVAVARKVISGEAETGVLVCGTGVGMSMTATPRAGDPRRGLFRKLHRSADPRPQRRQRALHRLAGGR